MYFYIILLIAIIFVNYFYLFYIKRYDNPHYARQHFCCRAVRYASFLCAHFFIFLPLISDIFASEKHPGGCLYIKKTSRKKHLIKIYNFPLLHFLCFSPVGNRVKMIAITANAVTANQNILRVTHAISKRDGRIISAPKVPSVIVTHRNALSPVKGIQLFITAAMEVRIRSRYITV